MNKSIRENGAPLNVSSPYGNSMAAANLATTTNGKRAPNFKHIESIEIQGQFKLRKVFTLRNKVQPDVEYVVAGRAGGSLLPPSSTLPIHHQASFASVQDADQLPPSGRPSNPREADHPGDAYSNASKPPDLQDHPFLAASDYAMEDGNQGPQEDDIAQ